MNKFFHENKCYKNLQSLLIVTFLTITDNIKSFIIMDNDAGKDISSLSDMERVGVRSETPISTVGEKEYTSLQSDEEDTTCHSELENCHSELVSESITKQTLLLPVGEDAQRAE